MLHLTNVPINLSSEKVSKIFFSGFVSRREEKTNFYHNSEFHMWLIESLIYKLIIGLKQLIYLSKYYRIQYRTSNVISPKETNYVNSSFGLLSLQFIQYNCKATIG